MKIHHKSAQPRFNTRAQGKGLLLLRTAYMEENVTIWAKRIDHVFSSDNRTIVIFRTSDNPAAMQKKESFAINFDLFMRALLAAERTGASIDLRPACNLPHSNSLSYFNGGKTPPDKIMRKLMRLVEGQKHPSANFSPPPPKP